MSNSSAILLEILVQRLGPGAVLDIVVSAIILTWFLGILRGTPAARILRALIGLVVLTAIFGNNPGSVLGWALHIFLPGILAGVIVIFQPELRRLLERLGAIGETALAATTQRSELEILQEAVQDLIRRKWGALILYDPSEAGERFRAVSDTAGTTINAPLQFQLLVNIFSPGAPLHDGAVLIRAGQIIAAGMVLPLGARPRGYGLGTRHRAAIGATSRANVLAIVVSEERQEVSVARNGEMVTLDASDHLASYLRGLLPRPISTTKPRKVAGVHLPTLPEIRQIVRDLGPRTVTMLPRFVLATMIVVSLWGYVQITDRPIRTDTFESPLPVDVRGLPQNLTVIESLPDVRVQIAAPADRWAEIRSSNFSASVDLTGSAVGATDIPIHVQSSDPEIRVVSVEPARMHLHIEEVARKSLPVIVKTYQQPSPENTMVSVTSDPPDLEISGPSHLVERVSHIEAPIVVNGSASFSQRVSPQPLDNNSQVVEGVHLTPDHVQVNVKIGQTQATKQLAVRAVWDGELPNGLVLTTISISPSTVIVSGPAAQLDNVNVALIKPFRLAVQSGEYTVTAPLQLPSGLTSNPSEVSVAYQLSRYAVEQKVQVPLSLVGLAPGLVARSPTDTVIVTLSGAPVAANRDLTVSIVVDLSNYGPGTFHVHPVARVSNGLTVNGIDPATVDVTVVALPTATPTPTVTPTLTSTLIPSTPTPTRPASETPRPVSATPTPARS